MSADTLRGKVSVLVPFRGDGDKRDILWNYCRSLWEKLPVELCVGEDPGSAPFNVARAFNDAASRATGDIFVLWGADQLPGMDRIRWAAEQLEHHPWVPLFAETGAYREDDTRLIVVNGADPDKFDFAQWAPFCTGIVAVTRAGWEQINGMDDRFYGWGGEDTALRIALEGILGPPPAPSGALRCLWHPAAPRDRFEANSALVGEYIAAEQAGTLTELVNSRPHWS